MLSGGGGFVSTYIVSSLFAAGYALDFGGDPGLAEACRGEFAGTFCSCKSVRLDLMLYQIV